MARRLGHFKEEGGFAERARETLHWEDLEGAERGTATGRRASRRSTPPSTWLYCPTT